MARGRPGSQKTPKTSAGAVSQSASVSQPNPSTSHASSGIQTGELADWREKKRAIKEARVEHGRKLQEKLRDMRAKGLLNGRKPQTLSQVSGLEFPVRRVIRQMKKLNPNRIVHEAAGVMVTGVVEYLCAEMLELAGNTAKAFNKKRISPREIFLAVKNDVELDKLLENATMAYSGALPNIHPSLLKTHKAMPASLQHKNNPNTSLVRDDNSLSPNRESLAERVEHTQNDATTPSIRKTQA